MRNINVLIIIIIIIIIIKVRLHRMRCVAVRCGAALKRIGCERTLKLLYIDFLTLRSATERLRFPDLFRVRLTSTASVVVIHDILRL